MTAILIPDRAGLSGAAKQDPARVVEEAEGRLHGRPYRALHKVCCPYGEGVLTLRGRLPSYYRKQLAQAAVAGVEGVLCIDNRIEVAAHSLEPPRARPVSHGP